MAYSYLLPLHGKKIMPNANVHKWQKLLKI